jgi:hypothetical protein
MSYLKKKHMDWRYDTTELNIMFDIANCLRFDVHNVSGVGFPLEWK